MGTFRTAAIASSSILESRAMNGKVSVKGGSLTVKLDGLPAGGGDEHLADLAMAQPEAIKVSAEKYTTLTGKVVKKSWTNKQEDVASWCVTPLMVDVPVGQADGQAAPEPSPEGNGNGKAKAKAK